jgi:7-keto-8-aminopelargonate synthetase-like enzyme
LYLITSLAKSFACSGSALVFPDEESRNKIRLAGNTMIFSGPLQPAILGSIIASAKIHLSNEIYERQAELMRRISYFNKTAELYNLPLIAPSNSPIFFIGVGTIPVAHNVTKKIFNRGYYLNVATFPSVPVNQCGLRIPITLHHSNEDIENLLAVIAEVLPQALKEENYSMEEIHKSFGLKGKETIQLPTN